MKNLKKIGILGGMGPEASANLYKLIIRLSQEKYDAKQDPDYPPMIINSIGLRGFDETGITNEDLVLEQLISENNVLYKAGCSFIVMACNTIHYFIDELRKNSKIPIISIIEETVKNIKQDNINKIGLLASDFTYKYNVYESVLEKYGIEVITPPHKYHQQITDLIEEVMGNKKNPETKHKVLSIVEKLKQKSVQAIVLGCTELPLAIKQKDTKIKIYDTLHILAESALDYSHK